MRKMGFLMVRVMVREEGLVIEALMGMGCLVVGWMAEAEMMKEQAFVRNWR